MSSIVAPTTAEHVKALAQVLQAVRAAVAAGGAAGVPAGTVYAALMGHGCTLAQYEQIEGLLIRAGAITKKGDLLFVKESG